MPTRIVVVWLAVACLGAVGFGCKQQPKEEADIPSTATPPPAVTVAATAAAPTEAPLDTIPPPVQPPPPPPPPTRPAASTTAAKPESIAACCSALQKEAATAAHDKGLYQTAAASCEAIGKLVAAGTTKKAAAMTQLRANLKGAKLPAGCE